MLCVGIIKSQDWASSPRLSNYLAHFKRERAEVSPFLRCPLCTTAFREERSLELLPSLPPFMNENNFFLELERMASKLLSISQEYLFSINFVQFERGMCEVFLYC